MIPPSSTYCRLQTARSRRQYRPAGVRFASTPHPLSFGLRAYRGDDDTQLPIPQLLCPPQGPDSNCPRAQARHWGTPGSSFRLIYNAEFPGFQSALALTSFKYSPKSIARFTGFTLGLWNRFREFPLVTRGYDASSVMRTDPSSRMDSGNYSSVVGLALQRRET
jgi:hypothetical protein